MALIPVHKYFVYNAEILDSSVFMPSENEGGIYEVLRVVNGIPLFLEEHLVRFYHSAEIAKTNIRFSAKRIEKLLTKLINKNDVQEGNILISYKTNLKAYFIQHNYPTEKMYRDGVPCGILKAERDNPNAKIFQTSVRDSANKMIDESNYYEVILVDNLDHITEGSKSNIFFIKDKELITPPGNQVLLGITRQKTIEAAEKLDITWKEELVNLADLKNYDAAFITGTSPKILSVSQIENNHFDTNNKIVTQLINGFAKLISDYISSKSN